MRTELARQQWQEGYRRAQAESAEPGARGRLDELIEAVTEELRRRVGGPYTIAELAEAYQGADTWARTAIAERRPAPGWTRLASIAADAAFHLYARGARDYRP